MNDQLLLNCKQKMSSRKIAKLFAHIKCRRGKYPGSDVPRATIPDGLIDWATSYPSYNPPYYEAAVLSGKPWADPKQSNDLRFNSLDGKVDRRSHAGEYEIVDSYPLNPYGRTGVKGRGVLGRWGPNHAADPIVSRWKRTTSGEIHCHTVSQKQILQICIIQRGDCGELALPGGMVDAGEAVSQTLKREFTEEALSSSNQEENEKSTIESFFAPRNGVEVYRNYVDDPRNTDNAWMETVAVNFHDASGEQVGRFNLCAGDDAAHVQWMDISGALLFYANHRQFIESVVQRLNAHW